MRPDAEPRQPQSSPTSVPPASPAPPASPVPPASPAPKKGGAGRKVLVGVGAVVLVVGSAVAGLAGGVVHGGATLQPPDDGAAPDAADERTAEAAAAEEPEERVEFRGMSVLVPEGWAAETVADSFGGALEPSPEDSVTEEWLTLYPEGQQACEGLEWSWADTTTGCAHIKVLGPSALQLGRAGGGPVMLENVGPNSSFSPGTNPAPCPEGVTPHTEADPGFRGIGQWEIGETKAGEQPAGYAEGSVVCSDAATGALTYVDQRIWVIEGAEILVVDGYGLDETESLLASAEW